MEFENFLHTSIDQIINDPNAKKKNFEKKDEIKVITGGQEMIEVDEA